MPSQSLTAEREEYLFILSLDCLVLILLKRSTTTEEEKKDGEWCLFF